MADSRLAFHELLDKLSDDEEHDFLRELSTLVERQAAEGFCVITKAHLRVHPDTACRELVLQACDKTAIAIPVLVVGEGQPETECQLKSEPDSQPGAVPTE